MNYRTAITCGIVAIFGVTSYIRGQQKRPIQPSDCITVRYVIDDAFHRAIQINPQGTDAAYLVRAPDLAANRNVSELYVKPLSGDPSNPARLILSGSRISQLRWLNDGIHLVALTNDDGRSVVIEIDIRNGTWKVLLKLAVDIREYAINGSGSVLVAATGQNSGATPAGVPRAREAARGYRIPFQRQSENGLPGRALLVTRRTRAGDWTPPEPAILHSPFTGKALTTIACQELLNLSLSPDGRLLSVSYVEAGRMPDSWREDHFVEQVRADGFPGIHVTVLYNLATRTTEAPIQTPWGYSTPLWAPDSSSFVITSRSPVGSRWEREDIREQSQAPHVFWVDVKTGTIEEVAKHTAYPVEAPLAWNPRTGILVQTGKHEVSRFTFRSGQWTRSSAFHIPLTGLLREVSSDGTEVIGETEAPTEPPQLFLYRASETHATVFSILNPQFVHLTLAPARLIEWKTSTGYSVNGFLFLPGDYVQGRRYPMVIQTKPSIGQFVCDSGRDHYPSFAPQPLANAGILYLIQKGSEPAGDQIANAPKGYPGGIREAAFNMDMWDSAVEKLAAEGIVDSARVGIIGFSRSGWYTEFILAHSQVHYRAATLADNVNYSMGEYWLLHTPAVIRGWDAMYGGPPYGRTLGNWMKYSISFTLDRIRTPVLMEEMGYGIPMKDDGKLPLDIAYSYELFTGLSRLGRPVELYYYPNEDHQPDDPVARLASLQRNVDWYRFWLQGYERPHPSDPQQYVRWQHLKALQQAEDQGKDSPNRY